MDPRETRPRRSSAASREPCWSRVPTATSPASRPRRRGCSRASPPRLPEALDGPLGDEDRHAVADRLRVLQPQALLVARLAEEPLAVAEDDREDHEPQFVDEVVLDECLNELDAAGHQDHPVHLLL